MQIIPRKIAKESCLTRFYTGKPCAHGHDSERYVQNGACVACIYKANGHSAPAVANEPAAPKGPSKASLVATLAEQRFRLFNVDAPALQRLCTALCLAAHPTLTEDDVRTRKGPTKCEGPVGLYLFRFPVDMQPMVQGMANSLFGAHSQANVDQFRASLVRKAQDLAIESRPPIPEWTNR